MELAPSVIILTVLLTGAALAGISRLVLPSSRRLAWSTTIVFAVLGAALAWLPLPTRRLLTDEVLDDRARHWP